MEIKKAEIKEIARIESKKIESRLFKTIDKLRKRLIEAENKFEIYTNKIKTPNRNEK